VEAQDEKGVETHVYLFSHLV